MIMNEQNIIEFLNAKEKYSKLGLPWTFEEFFNGVTAITYKEEEDYEIIFLCHKQYPIYQLQPSEYEELEDLDFLTKTEE